MCCTYHKLGCARRTRKWDLKNSQNLIFWLGGKRRLSQFPVLAAMTRDLLSVQASMVASETAFSTNERVLSIRRTRLTPTSLEMCICLKDHLDAAERTQKVSSHDDKL